MSSRPETSLSAHPLADVLDASDVVVCSGAGGVGKTTSAAALAVAAAHRGRNVVVVTVDPARRLADALGVSELGNTPAPLLGPWSGSLHAVMLDVRATFDHLVRTHAGTPDQAEAILENPLYRNISSALSGTQEYMAIEKLHELHADRRFDLVVVDTPPSRNALDLLDAPRRLVRFLEHPLYRLFTAPTRSLARAFGVAARSFLWTVKRVAGADVVDAAMEFFTAFEGMEAGFRDRAAEMGRVLAAPTTAFLVVSSPRQHALEEAGYLIDGLADAQLHLRGLVVNLVHEAPEPLDDPGLAEHPAGAPWRWLTGLAAAERDEIARLGRRAPGVPVVTVPVLERDVTDLEGLETLATHLVGPDTGSGAGPR